MGENEQWLGGMLDGRIYRREEFVQQSRLEGSEAECKRNWWSYYRRLVKANWSNRRVFMSTTSQLEITPMDSDILAKSPYHWFIAAVSLFHHPSALHITGHEPFSFLFYCLTPSHHLLHLIILSSLPPHTSGQALLCRPWHMHSTITLLCHHSSEIADVLLSLTPLLTDFTAMPSLSPASPPLSLALSVFLLSPLIPFRGKSILLGSGSKSCGSEHLICLSCFSLGGAGGSHQIRGLMHHSVHRIQAG